MATSSASSISSEFAPITPPGRGSSGPPPGRLERVGDEPVVRVNLHEPPASELGLVAGSLHLLEAEPVRLIDPRLELLLHRQRDIERHRRHRLE